MHNLLKLKQLLINVKSWSKVTWSLHDQTMIWNIRSFKRSHTWTGNDKKPHIILSQLVKIWFNMMVTWLSHYHLRSSSVSWSNSCSCSVASHPASQRSPDMMIVQHWTDKKAKIESMLLILTNHSEPLFGLPLDDVFICWQIHKRNRDQS